MGYTKEEDKRSLNVLESLKEEEKALSFAIINLSKHNKMKHIKTLTDMLNRWRNAIALEEKVRLG